MKITAALRISVAPLVRYVGILDNTGREVVQYRYDAWGNVRTEVLNEAHALIAEINPFRYRSYYYN